MKNRLLLSIASGAALVTALSSCGSAGPGTESAAQDTESSQETDRASAPDSSQPAEETMTAEESAAAAPSQPSSPPPTRVDAVGGSHGASFTTYTEDAVAITYDPDFVPEDAPVTLTRNMGVSSTSMSVQVAGLPPNQKYGAHVHMNTCGPTAKDAGPRYQHEPGPSPAAATPDKGNELWIPFVTDSQGQAQASAAVNWPIRPGQGHSLVFHAEGTPAADESKRPGDRVACFVLGRTDPPL